MKITAQALFACDECGLLGEQEIAVPGAISPGVITWIGVPAYTPRGTPFIQWIERQR